MPTSAAECREGCDSKGFAPAPCWPIRPLTAADGGFVWSLVKVSLPGSRGGHTSWMEQLFRM